MIRYHGEPYEGSDDQANDIMRASERATAKEAKAVKVPEFKVHCSEVYPSLSNEIRRDVRISWADQDRRYHVNIFYLADPLEIVVIDDVIHSNPLVPKSHRRIEHRLSDATSKRWAPVIQAILQKVKDEDLIPKAIDERNRIAAEEKAAAEKAEDEKALKRLDAAAIHLPADFAAKLMKQDPEALRKFARALS